MRFLLLPIAIGALTVGDVAARGTRSDPRPIVVLVHGRGQLGLDSAMVRREWKRDLDSSLAKVGMPPLRDTDVRLAWYADVLDPESDSGCTTTNEDDLGALGFGALTRGIFASLTSGLPEQDTRDARGLIGDLLYLVDSWTRCGVERRVGQVIEAALSERRPVIVVAYSLGSLVAYSHLNTLAPRTSPRDDLRLITIGSPLGVHEIRAVVLEDERGTLALPASAKSWINIYDPDDPFSAQVSHGAGTLVVQDRTTQEPAAGDAHHVSRYLTDRATGLALAQALCSTSAGQPVTECGRLVSR